ncbi:MAG: hypothetical protein J6C40_14940 [Lentisphaeria bacterium]|nr:hypothetical protein [Lentisphaeria bacterium]
MVKNHKNHRLLCLAGLALMVCGTLSAAENDSIRTIRLRQDDAQVRFESKVYELQNTTAEEILPFINSAVLRYDRNSTVRRVTSGTKGEALLVSTGKEFVPYVDKIVAVLDRKVAKKSADGSTISGTGLTRISYSPKYRAAADLANVLNATIGSDAGALFVNDETNTIFWRDQDASAKRTLTWLEKLDRPLPQVRLRLNYYEVRDSELKDWGFDYLAWKNGPGVNLLNVGYNAGELVVHELLDKVPYVLSSSWGMGGFFTAPQFDMSFIRCLQQGGNTSAVGTGSLLMINTPVGSKADLAALRQIQSANPATAPFIYRTSMTPEYQNIGKNILGRTLIGKSYYEDANGVKHADPPRLELQVLNPFVCLTQGNDPQAGGVIFDYSLYFKSVVERGNIGSELSNTALFSGSSTLAFGKEKILAVYEKENEVEQTIGLPVLCRIPVLKYLFSTVTSIKERTYIVVSAEAALVDIEGKEAFNTASVATGIDRRIENPFRVEKTEKKAEKSEKSKK